MGAINQKRAWGMDTKSIRLLILAVVVSWVLVLGIVKCVMVLLR